MIFYLVDPNNNYVEFMDNNFNSNKNPGLNGNNIKIGSTIVNNGTTYTIIGSAYGNGDCGGLGSSQVNSTLSGQLTIPSTMLYISRNFIRGQKNITQLIIPADSQLESIGECSLMGCTGIQTLDIPASVTTIFYGFFSQYNSDVASTTTHIYFRSPKMIYARDIQSENYYIFYSPGSTAYTDHFIKGTKGTKDGILYVPANLVDTYRTNSD
jgi:hypothetical protein